MAGPNQGVRRVAKVRCKLIVSIVLSAMSLAASAQESERVTAITPPRTPLPSEAQSRAVTRFSFIVYGDTRGARDGGEIQYEHSRGVDSMLAQITELKGSPYPVRFVFAVGARETKGRKPEEWNVSCVPLNNRLRTEGEVSYFLVPGNHELTA